MFIFLPHSYCFTVYAMEAYPFTQAHIMFTSAPILLYACVNQQMFTSAHREMYACAVFICVCPHLASQTHSTHINTHSLL